MNQLQPWEQQPGEDDNKYYIFLYYLQLEGIRSYQIVANTYKLSLRTIKNYSKKYNWIQRIKEFDKYIQVNYYDAVFDYINDYREKKFVLKTEISITSLEIMKELNESLNVSDQLSKYDFHKKRYKFIDDTLKIIEKLDKHLKFKISPEIMHYMYKSEIKKIKMKIQSNSNNFFDDKKTKLIVWETIAKKMNSKLYYTRMPNTLDDIEIESASNENGANSAISYKKQSILNGANSAISFHDPDEITDNDVKILDIIYKNGDLDCDNSDIEYRERSKPTRLPQKRYRDEDY